MTSERLDLPARRRHARLIASLTGLIAACAEAASAVQEPIAAAPPGQEDIEVDLMPLSKVAVAAGVLLDRARAEDDARWPAAVTQERAASRRTYAARCAVAAATELTEQHDPFGEHRVPLPTVEQAALMDLVSVGDEVAERWLTDPETAATVVRNLVAGGELTVDEVFDEAVDSAVVTGLLALHKARTASDPSTAAKLCLTAVPHIALAATLAGTDLD